MEYKGEKRMARGIKVNRGLWWGLLVVALAAVLYGYNRVSYAKAWALTGTFDVPATAADGTRFHYRMRGVEGQFGFIDVPFVAGEGNKFMWHFWGNPEDFNGKTLEVTGVSQSGQSIPVLKTALSGPNNGAVAHTPSMMSLPSLGLWRLEVRVDSKHIGNIVVEAVPSW